MPTDDEDLADDGQKKCYQDGVFYIQDGQEKWRGNHDKADACHGLRKRGACDYDACIYDIVQYSVLRIFISEGRQPGVCYLHVSSGTIKMHRAKPSKQACLILLNDSSSHADNDKEDYTDKHKAVPGVMKHTDNHT